MRMLLLGLLMAFTTACTVVGPGDRAVRLNFGEAQNQVLEPGPHLYIPVARTAVHLSVRVQKTEVTTSSASKDLQEIKTNLAINWSIDPVQVATVYKNVGTQESIVTRILTPAANEVFKAAAAKLTAEEILTQRIQLKNDIDVALKERLTKYGLLVSDISIVDLQFSSEFTNAIEQKQIAEQQAKQAKYLAAKAVETAEGEAKARIVNAKSLAEATLLKAKAEAKANRTVSQSITNSLIKYEKVKKWNGTLPKFTGGNNTLLSIPAE